MDRDQVRQWREGWLAVERFHRLEVQQLSDEERWRLLNVAAAMLKSLGRPIHHDDDQIEEVRQRWLVLKQRHR